MPEEYVVLFDSMEKPDVIYNFVKEKSMFLKYDLGNKKLLVYENGIFTDSEAIALSCMHDYLKTKFENSFLQARLALDTSPYVRLKWIKQNKDDDIQNIKKKYNQLVAPGSMAKMLKEVKAYRQTWINTDDLDPNPELLKVNNGVVNLRNGELLEDDPKYLITMKASADYDKEAKSEVWDKFLLQCVSDDENYLEWLQYLIGYVATGYTREEIIPIVIGPPGTGKTTFLEAVMNTLGTYATPTQPAAFVKGSGSIRQHTLASIKRMRLVLGSEFNENDKLDTAIVKSLVSGDETSVREIYKAPSRIDPSCKLIFATNYMPFIDDKDTGFVRRFIAVPFTNSKIVASADYKLKDELKNHRNAILNWIVEGSKKYLALNSKFGVTNSIRQATSRYLDHGNPIAMFLKECTVKVSRGSVIMRTMYNTYEQWSSEEGIKPLNYYEFNKELLKCGLVKGKSNDSRVWSNIKIL